MAKRLNKNDITRGRIFDKLAEIYGTSVLGFYDGKLRIEIIEEETGEVIQFSLAPVVHKTLIDEVECDPYVSTDDRIAEYQASLKKTETKKSSKSKKTKEVVAKEKKVEVIPVEEFNFDEPVVQEPVEEKKPVATEPVISVDEQARLDTLMEELGF